METITHVLFSRIQATRRKGNMYELHFGDGVLTCHIDTP